MKCQICGTRTLPGATLCGPCKAALKRARQETVQDLKPLRKSARRTAKQRVDPAEETSELATLASHSSAAPLHAARSRVPLALAIAVVAIAAAHFGFTGPDAQAPVGAQTSAPAPAPSTQAPPPVSAPLAVESAGGGAVQPVAAAEPNSRPPAKPVVETPKNATPRTSASVAKPVRDVPTTVSPSAPDTLTSFGPDPNRAAPPPAPAAPVPPPASPPPPDRKQLLEEALARCTGNFLARGACEEGVRMQRCEGLWGQTPQCPSREPIERGQ